jgi:hypothetical protein
MGADTDFGSDLDAARMTIVRLETDLAHLSKQVDGMRQDMTGLAQQLQEIQRTLATARGGWQTLMWAGGAAAAAGSAISWALQHVQIRG